MQPRFVVAASDCLWNNGHNIFFQVFVAWNSVGNVGVAFHQIVTEIENVDIIWSYVKSCWQEKKSSQLILTAFFPLHSTKVHKTSFTHSNMYRLWNWEAIFCAFPPGLLPSSLDTKFTFCHPKYAELLWFAMQRFPHPSNLVTIETQGRIGTKRCVKHHELRSTDRYFMRGF